MQRDVFICYSHKDQAIADMVCDMLEAADIKCWISSRDEKPGEKWAEMIVRGLDESKILIFILSTHSNSSTSCTSELALAHEKRKFIIPVKLEDVALSGELQYRLAGRQRIDVLTQPIEEQLSKLVDAVREFLKSSLVTATYAAERQASPESNLEQKEASQLHAKPHVSTSSSETKVTEAHIQHTVQDPRVKDSRPPTPELAIEFTNSGMSAQSKGDLANARACFENALNISLQTSGSDHPVIAARHSNLGTVLRAMGDLTGARAHFEKALEIDELSYGNDSPAVAKNCNNLGMVYQAQGDLDTACDFFRRALSIYQGSLGDDSPYAAAVRRNIRLLAIARGNQLKDAP